MENCGRLRAFLRPALRRSLTRASRVSMPRRFSSGRSAGSTSQQGPGDAVADGGRLARDAASVHADADVDVALVAALSERLLGDRLQVGTGEVLLERALVDLDAPVAGPQDHAGHGGLPLAGGRVAGVARELGGLRRDGRRLVLVADQLALAASALLLLGLAAGALLGIELALRLDRDRVELRAGDDILLLPALGLGLPRAGAAASSAGVSSSLRRVLGEGLLGRHLLGVVLSALGAAALRGRCLLGRLLLLGLLLLGRALVRLLLLFVLHQVSISSGSGFWAWWGCSGPAYTLSLRSCWRPSRLRGIMPLTACG